ncbi:MAG TPA: B12-binding domain-containing radical SAM protein [Desulfuromonadales bacterium]|nr:B12-binding domain-containing radical SAM protein [Desulfuromonadales bacterium]
MHIVLTTLHVRPSAQAVPLAAACLAAALPEDLRRQTRLLDLFPGEDDEQMLTAILAGRPDLVAFPLYLWNRRRVLALARRLRQRRPELFLLAGGPEATTDPEGVLAEGELDAVIRGEGEITFRDLLAARDQGIEPAGLAGLTLRTAAGVVAGPERAAVARLDELSSPWLTGVLTPTAGSGVLWETSRGCPFACDFCYDARGGHGVRALSAERLQAELDLFVRAGVSQVWVLDSTFNFPPERGRELLRLLSCKAPHIHFHLEAKADYLDRETARLLARLSCSVQIGLQSARPEVLRSLHRALDPDLFARQLRLLAAEGVTFGIDLIYGLPGDDYQGFCRSLTFALQLTPNHLDIFPLAVLPGTPLHRHREDFAIEAGSTAPYLLRHSASWSESDMGRSRRLAAAVDLFYNLGRAVGFFAALLKGAGTEPVPFLEGFTDWLLKEKRIEEQRFLAVDAWRPDEVRQLQEDYIGHQLRRQRRESLLPAALDLLRYHFHYAETLLGVETLPAPPEKLAGLNPWTTRWRTAPTVRLVRFAYEVLDLLEMGEPDLERFTALFRPVGSMALFVRRGAEVVCESLQEDFLKLLEGSDGTRSPQEIFAGSLSRAMGEEIVAFAVAEGLLVPGE